MKRRTAVFVALAPVVATSAWFGVGIATASGGSAVHGWAAHRTLPGKAAPSVAAAVARAHASAAASGGRTLTLVERAGAQGVIDVGPKGPSVGDAFVSENRLYDSSGKTLVGRDYVRCEAGIRTFTCEATGQLFGHGKVRVGGTLFTDNENTLPITGGTGAFQGAGGQLTTYDVNDDTTVLFLQFSH